MNDTQARRLATKVGNMATVLSTEVHDLGLNDWPVSAQQLQNAVNLLRDVERRLRNGMDWQG